ncbi:hypothetical protein BDW74DRAFT_173184 [Aspergillus multicolor]|uniref:uncharacterized protein n=1 Tax=Aspergillus multicolor TaxID=41759 RepID=UPI003CCDD319
MFLALFLLFRLTCCVWAQYPQDVELDLVFPHNDTYTPLRYFPIILGLQNARAAWPQRFGIRWTLWRFLDFGDLEEMQSDKFPDPLSYHEGTYPFEDIDASQPGTGVTDGPAPVDPFFYFYFPGHIMNSTAGHWKLTWQFGFFQNCSSSSESPDRLLNEQPMNEVVFRTEVGGKEVNLTTLQERCPGYPRTFRIEGSMENDGVCPIFGETDPEPEPCALEVPESLWENTTRAAEIRTDCQLDGLQCSAGGRVDSLYLAQWVGCWLFLWQ